MDTARLVCRSAPPQRPSATFGLTTAAELAVAVKRHAHRAPRRCQGDAAVGNIEHEVRQCERLAARRRQQLVDLTPTRPAIHQPPTEPYAAGDNAIDGKAAVPLQSSLDMRIFGNQVRPLRIADDEVADFLGSKANPVEMIARADPAALKLAP